jgi:hypothetical protein
MSEGRPASLLSEHQAQALQSVNAQTIRSDHSVEAGQFINFAIA